jgi:hypothetical protein
VRVVECEHFTDHVGIKAVSLGKPLDPLIPVRQQIPRSRRARIADHGLPPILPGTVSIAAHSRQLISMGVSLGIRGRVEQGGFAMSVTRGARLCG